MRVTIKDDQQADDVQGLMIGTLAAGPFLQRVAAIAPGIIYVFNQITQSNEYSNRELATALGYSAQEVQSMGAEMLPSLFHPDDLEKLAAHFASIQALDDGDMAQLEYRMRHRDGRWVWLLSHDTVFERLPDGSVKRHIGVATDITIQKEAEARIEAERRAATAANEELRSFAYSISHDMKSPSNTMHLILNELLETQASSLDADGRELIQHGLETVVRMQRLIEDVLNYTRVVGEDIEMETLLLTDVVRAVLDDMRGDITDTGACVDLGDLPIVRGHSGHLSILFSNLVSNALKYVPPGRSPVVRISDITNPGSNTLSVQVADNGIGIPKALQERIFTIFKRLHLQEEYEGTGLGLAISRRIALNHGGTIEVESEPGEGSIFILHVPRPAI